MSDAFYVIQVCRTLLKALKYMIRYLYEFDKDRQAMETSDIQLR